MADLLTQIKGGVSCTVRVKREDGFSSVSVVYERVKDVSRCLNEADEAEDTTIEDNDVAQVLLEGLNLGLVGQLVSIDVPWLHL